MPCRCVFVASPLLVIATKIVKVQKKVFVERILTTVHEWKDQEVVVVVVVVVGSVGISPEL